MRGFHRRIQPIVAAVFELLGKFDDQNGVLGRQADQDDEADLRQQIVVHAAQDHADDRGDQAHWNDQNDGERQRQALKLRRQHQEHEHHRQHESENRGVAGADLLEGERGPFVGEAGRQNLLRQLLHDMDGLALAVAGGGSAVELGGRIEIVARHAIGAGDVAHGGEGAERHRAAGIVAHADVENVLGVVAELARSLRDHAVGAAQYVEIVDVERAEIDLQGREYVRDVDAEQLRLGAIDIEIDFRRVGLEQ